MNRIALTVLLAAGATGTAAATAQAAAVSVDHRCYFSEPGARQPVRLHAAGFVPSAPLAIRVGAKSFSATSDPTGAASFRVPAPAIATNQSRAALSVSDGARTAATSFYVTRVRADFLPSRTRHPSTFRVRFHVYGLGAVLAAQRRSQRASVYLHWLAPNHRLRATKRIGRLSGPCGSMISSRQQALPFAIEYGRWSLLFDTRPRYSRATIAQAGVGIVVSRVRAR